MTQGQLAEILDIESVTMSRIETGAQLPSIDRLDEIAKALKVSLTTLLADTNKSSAIADLIVEAIRELPVREQKYVHSFAMTYAAHWKAGKKKL
jgi:transcriptional regulator with XRE-family HTH domain